MLRVNLKLSLQLASKGLIHNNLSVLCFWSLAVSTDSPVGSAPWQADHGTVQVAY